MSEELTCGWCSTVLNKEQRENPYRDDSGDVICDTCYTRNFEGICDRCEEIVPKKELKMRPGELLAFWEEVDGLQPGYYRVLRWPIYADGMIEGFVYTENLQFVCALDAQGLNAAEDAYTPGGSLCEECRKAIEANLLPSPPTPDTVLPPKPDDQ